MRDESEYASHMDYIHFNPVKHGISASAAEWLSDQEVDSLLDQGRSTLDQTERAAIYKKVFDRIRDLQPSIFGYQVVITYAKSDRVSVPALQDPAKNTRVMGMNLMFRAMEMK